MTAKDYETLKCLKIIEDMDITLINFLRQEICHYALNTKTAMVIILMTIATERLPPMLRNADQIYSSISM